MGSEETMRRGKQDGETIWGKKSQRNNHEGWLTGVTNILDITCQVTQWGDWQGKRHNNRGWMDISPALVLIRAYYKLKVMCILLFGNRIHQRRGRSPLIEIKRILQQPLVNNSGFPA